MTRGTLRVYLGAAPGVGKTFAMLNEGKRRLERGEDIVIGLVETHNRPLTLAQIADLEVVPRKTVLHRGIEINELDVEAIIERCPNTVLIDEMAHSNVGGMRHSKRWEDIDEIRDAGINVLTTLNIQHLESVNDVVEQITGVAQHETIPDRMVREADQVELVDISPDALRRRMAHGNIYSADRVNTALANYFRIENLTSLRELALLWVADQVDDALAVLRNKAGIATPWGVREKVVVAVEANAGADHVIRRAARIAQRAHADLVAVNIRTEDGLRDSSGDVAVYKRLVADLGGEFQQLAAADVAEALVAFARSENATQIVLGASQRSRFDRVVHGSNVNRAIELSGDIDVHVVSHESSDQATVGESLAKFRRVKIARRRRMASWIAGVIGFPLLTFALTNMRHVISLPGDLLLYLLLVVIVAALGGLRPGIVSAIAGFAVANYYFTPPIHHWEIADRENLLALIVFLAIATVVSALVDRAARRTLEAVKANSEAQELARLSATMAHEDPLVPLVSLLRSSFRVAGVTVLSKSGEVWHVEASDSSEPRISPEGADFVEPLGPMSVVAIDGDALEAKDLDLLRAFLGQIRVALEGRELREQAKQASDLRITNDLRAALLQAVSHDLRTPLAGIKASVSSLRQDDVTWSASATKEFLAMIEEETDRLNQIIGNLLDMSKIQAGIIAPTKRTVGVEDLVSSALQSLGSRALGVEVQLPRESVFVSTDAGLTERAIANLVDNAIKWSPAELSPRIEGAVIGSQMVLRVVDCGPGIAESQRDRVFEPFQRVDDRANDSGVGLGLAVARGFVRAVGSEITLEDTPGGGVTMEIRLDIVK